MTDRPILFSAPMVRALLEGRKTQTRRILKPQPDELFEGDIPKQIRIRIGDRLYVREHWRTTNVLDDVPPRDLRASENEIVDYTPIHYEADGERRDYHPYSDPPFGKHRQAMHMPKWASRLTLIVTDVRVERLQDISKEDAIAEGVSWNGGPGTMKCPWGIIGINKLATGFSIATDAYASLWNHINGPGAWEQNPWVVAYTFTVHQQNIDQLEAMP